MKSLIIGTRGSKLALYQTNLVLNKIKKILPNVRILTKVIKTKGDLLLDKDLTKVLDKGFFTSEIQEALYDEEIDVYEAKDYCVERVNQFCKSFNNNNWCWQFVEFWHRLDKAEKFELLESLKLRHIKREAA